MLLGGEVAVITGGGRGIGRAIALKFAGEGAAVVVAARTQSEIEAVAQEIRNAGGRAAAVPADVAEEKHCERLIRAAEAQFGRVDILVNNAGEYGPVKPVEEITPPEWDRVVAVHLRGAYLLTRLVLPAMYARGRSRSSPQRRARECDLPRPRDGNEDVQGFGRDAGGTPGSVKGRPAPG